MRSRHLAFLVPCLAALASPAVADPVSIALPGGKGGIGFDDLRFSPSLHRVLAPAGRTGKLALIDPATRKVEVISGFSSDAKFGGGHGQGTTSVDEGAGMLFAIDRGSTEVIVIDPKAKKITSRTKLAGKPDYVRWVDKTKEVWVTEPSLKQIEYFTFDKGKLASAGTIAVDGGPESLAIDGTRAHAYTHTWQDKTVVLDLAKHAEVTRFANGCKESRGIALDEPRGLLFVGCEEGAATAVDITHDPKLLGTVPAGKGVDIIAYDAKLQHLYVPGGDDATLTIVGFSAKHELVALGTVKVAADSHCVTADDKGHAYVCDPGSGALIVVSDSYPASPENPSAAAPRAPR